MSIQDYPTLSIPVVLTGPLSGANLTDGISSDITLASTMDGATTLTFDVADYDRTLTRSGLLGTTSYAQVGGYNFVLVAISKSTDTVTLTFEDAVVNALRRRTTPGVIAAANTSTRQQIAKKLAAEAGVTIVCDPTVRTNVADAVVRNETMDAGSSGTKADNKYVADPTGTDSSWSILQSLAADAGWRCFSDGKRLLFGSDAWLETLTTAVAIEENVGPVGGIDFDFDTGQASSSATVTVSVDAWSVKAGYPVSISKLGPANGTWLIESYRALLNRSAMAGELDLVRAQPVLPESLPSESADDVGDDGDTDFLPDDTGDQPTTVYDRLNAAAASSGASNLAGTSGAREKMLKEALSHISANYLFGASGPLNYDCSGLVMVAMKAGGLSLPKPASAQWKKCQALGVDISVAAALKTRGALLFRIDYPPGDHVVISLGDGRTMEARGKAYNPGGVSIFDNAAKRHWTGGALPL